MSNYNYCSRKRCSICCMPSCWLLSQVRSNYCQSCDPYYLRAIYVDGRKLNHRIEALEVSSEVFFQSVQGDFSAVEVSPQCTAHKDVALHRQSMLISRRCILTCRYVAYRNATEMLLHQKKMLNSVHEPMCRNVYTRRCEPEPSKGAARRTLSIEAISSLQGEKCLQGAAWARKPGQQSFSFRTGAH